MPKQDSEQSKQTEPAKSIYYLPDFNVSVEADSLEEAIKLARKKSNG